MIFSGQRHSVSAADIYPQPGGWGVVSVGGTLLQGRTDLHTRPVDTWKVKLAKCGGTVWDPQEQALPQTNLSPPSTSQSCRGPKVLGKEEPVSVTPKIFRLNPLIYFCPNPHIYNWLKWSFKQYSILNAFPEAIYNLVKNIEGGLIFQIAIVSTSWYTYHCSYNEKCVILNFILHPLESTIKRCLSC